MSVWRQITLGSLTLVVCVVVHIAVLGVGVDLLSSWGESENVGAAAKSWILLVLIACTVVLVGHTLQVWVWALAFRGLGALARLDEAVYFSLVTTTTVGYGDVTLDRGFRVFGAMAAVSGLMTYGVSTAFLVGLTAYIFEGAP